MKYFFGPGNNSLSHLMKCLSVMTHLSSRGHEVHIAAGKKYSIFLSGTGFPYSVLPSIQERDDSGFPTLKWFSDSTHIRHCIQTEADLLREIRPDRALGVFNFTLPISSAMARIPYDTLICGCMLRESEEILGFRGDECDCRIQKVNMETFFYYASEKIKAAVNGEVPFPIRDVRELLRGEHTFLWDFPEFMPLPPMKDIFHVGPILYRNPESQTVDHSSFFSNPKKTAVISFGTCSGNDDILKRLTRICIGSGFKVFIAAGGNDNYMRVCPNEPDVCVQLFPDLGAVLDQADIFISHGGQLSVFQALKSQVPVLVMPFQPEQAHNGICLERMGCGRLMIPSTPFRVDSGVYLSALEAVSDDIIAHMITAVSSDHEIAGNVASASNILKQYAGTEQLVPILEAACI